MDMAKPMLYFDLEGPVNNPEVDLAWKIIDDLSNLGPEYHDRVQRFDEYDDARWLAERDEKGHSTGTTPLVSLMIAAVDGITDEKLVEYTNDIIKLNPGAKEMLKSAKEVGDVYFVTNSYPAAAILTAKKEEIEIPSSRVFTLGYQYYGRDRVRFDRMKLEEEIERRSPMEVFLKHRDQLKEFLDKYLQACENILAFYEKGEGNLKELIQAHDKIFQEVPNEHLKTNLQYLLLNEEGIMGGHNKAEVFEATARKGEEKFYLGDSIVDADPIDIAEYGISVNCTNKEALMASKLNAVLTNFEGFIPILERIRNGRFDPKEIRLNLSEDWRIIYTPDFIRDNFNEVVNMNRAFKTKLKSLYKD
jgi:predicted HAD superfamily phosphohydrolase